MAKVKTIKVKLTDEQMQQLAPLFEQVKHSTERGFIIGQVWENGYMMVGFTNPLEVKAGMEKHINRFLKTGG
jgi:hypothetical protein